MVETMSAGRFREQAALCQRLAKSTLSVEMAHRFAVLAEEYEAIAGRMDRARHRAGAAFAGSKPQVSSSTRAVVPDA